MEGAQWTNLCELQERQARRALVEEVSRRAEGHS